MPNFISRDGIWYVAKERVALKNNSNQKIINPSEEGSKYAGEEVGPGEPFIYEGPDRASLFELFKTDPSGNVTTLGQHFSDDIQMQDMVRQRGYKSVADYAKTMGYNKEKTDERFSELIAKVETHDLPKKVAMIEAAQSGGMNTAGTDGHMRGGFGEAPFVK